MAFEMSSPANVTLEPLEQEAQSGPTDEAPDEALLAELGVEFSTAQQGPKEEPAKPAAEDSPEAEPEAEGEETVEEEEKPKEEVEPKGRAQKRIQSLAKEKRALEERLARRDQEFRQQMQLVQQQQMAQAEALAQQNAVLQRQLEMLAAREQGEDLSKLTPMEQYERGLLTKAQALAEEKLSPRIQALEQELAQERAAREEAINRSRRKASLQKYTERADNAAKTHLMSDVDTGVFTPEEADLPGQLVLSYVAATGAPPEEASQQFKLWLDKYHQGRLRKVSNTSGSRIQQSRKVPAPLQQSKTSVQAEAMPSLQELREHGFDNHVQWMGRGSPRLAKK